MTTQQDNGLKYRISEHNGRLYLHPEDSREGLKGPSSYWATYLRCPWSHRRNGYAISRRKIERMEWLERFGYSPGVLGDRLYDSRREKVDDPTAKGTRKRWHENVVDALCASIRERAIQNQKGGTEA